MANRFQIIALTTLLLQSSFSDAASLQLRIDAAEGGRQSQTNITALEQYLGGLGCDVGVMGEDSTDKADLFFNTRPVTQALENGYRRLVAPATWQDYPLTTTLLIKSSTGISEAQSIAGERIAFVSEHAYIGRTLSLQWLSEHKVEVSPESEYLTGDYQGSMTMLLHGDVFSAAIAGPLAHRWAEANDLTLLYESEPQDIGYIWISKAVSSARQHRCQLAFQGLQRESRRDKRMRLFPLWLEGFR
ncbi:PhnD/SsuA/transferrin family substrate-binding protein [Amphritea sp. HPY]|uniref:PhnD/SsuA/transferrin family substrate-binding protein n=1 Tax=Amphritea sp. HPY TaxID=3421652 RepID=UPI003D7D21EC